MTAGLRRTTPLLGMVALLFAACNNPVDREDHVEPVGLIIRAGDTQVVAASLAGAQGSIRVTGMISPLYTVSFVDINGNVIDPGTEYHLVVQSENSAVAVWQASRPGAFTGTVAGKSAGSTTLRFSWVHGPVGGGHPDVIINVPVTIASNEPQ